MPAMSVEDRSIQFASRIAQARAKFLERADVKFSELLSTSTGNSSELMKESRTRTVHRLVHDLVGSAAMVGLPEVAAQMRPVCDRLADKDAAGENMSKSLIADIEDAVEKARVILSDNPG